ncbi:redoxin domain-containing protein [Methylobacillus gramineus]|uniref:redoxin domain-containing protein n=1 Tax=Methylobacillus gramineus TaxID=755169 RepID=UPI001CFF694C|nr:redoxin domain-containing protein [Methylobacillus gramineus]MCB5185495.1 redoxin domain-containing protein [Methylobacillus gramineus]
MLLRQLLNIAIFGTSLAFLPLAANAAADIGKPAPAFSVKTANGDTLSLDSLKGKTVVLEWTNNECPYVVKHYGSGNIPNLQKDAVAQGIVWLQVISSAEGKQGHLDGPSAIKLNTERGAAPSKVLLDYDGKIGKQYDAQTTPHIFIINPEGVLVYKGGIDSIATAKVEDIAKADNYVKLALGELASGKKVSHASTKPYGCSIKYAS